VSSVVTIAGQKYVSLASLIAACNDPQTIANAVAFLKIGIGQGHSLAEILQRVFAGYALSVAGETERIELTPEQLANLDRTIARPCLHVIAENQAKPGSN
jgi:hypothetical protein